jgi:hypothetical protein
LIFLVNLFRAGERGVSRAKDFLDHSEQLRVVGFEFGSSADLVIAIFHAFHPVWQQAKAKGAFERLEVDGLLLVDVDRITCARTIHRGLKSTWCVTRDGHRDFTDLEVCWCGLSPEFEFEFKQHVKGFVDD